MRKLNMLLAGILFLLTACSGNAVNASSIPTITPSIILPTGTAFVPSTETALPADLPSPLPAPTITLVRQGPGDVTVPILLYHHIDDPAGSIYHISPQAFEEQMKILKDWGYTSITIKDLVKAIKEGTKLPPRPVLITFDDGNMDNYTNAFPIMEKYGFSGVLYLVANYIGAQGYLNREQILEMVRSGWEVGNHSMDHYDVTKLTPEEKDYEIKQSKKRLEALLGIKIMTFAYPYGTIDGPVAKSVYRAGYIAAMGAEGYTADQGKWNLFNLQRVAISGLEDIQSFTRFLPWHGEPVSVSLQQPLPKVPIPADFSTGGIQ